MDVTIAVVSAGGGAKLGEELTQYQKVHASIASRLPTFIYMDDYKTFHGRADLVRQRVDHRRVDCQQRVEQVREADALRFGHQPEQRTVTVEAPRPPLGDDLEPGLVVAVEQFGGDRAGRRLVGQLDRLRAEPLHADDGHYAVGMHAPDSAARSKVFELHGGTVTIADARHLVRGGAIADRCLHVATTPAPVVAIRVDRITTDASRRLRRGRASCQFEFSM